MTVHDIETEYQTVCEQHLAWELILQRSRNPTLAIRGILLALGNQAGALQCLWRRVNDQARFIPPHDDPRDAEVVAGHLPWPADTWGTAENKAARPAAAARDPIEMVDAVMSLLATYNPPPRSA